MSLTAQSYFFQLTMSVAVLCFCLKHACLKIFTWKISSGACGMNDPRRRTKRFIVTRDMVREADFEYLNQARPPVMEASAGSPAAVNGQTTSMAPGAIKCDLAIIHTVQTCGR